MSIEPMGTEVYTLEPGEGEEVRKIGATTVAHIEPCPSCIDVKPPMVCDYCNGDGFILLGQRYE